MNRCIDFATRWGFDQLKMANLFAYITPERSVMKQQEDPIGTKNDSYLTDLAEKADLIVICWGNDGVHLDRCSAVLKLLKPFNEKIKCFGYTNSGQPKHPLYLAKTTELVEWNF